MSFENEVKKEINKEEIEEARTTLTRGKITLLEEELSQINPAVDMLPDNTAIITHPAPYKKIKIIKQGKQETEIEVEEIGNICYLSTGEFFELAENELRKRKLVAKMPDVLLRSRWSLKSRLDFIKQQDNKVDPYRIFKEIKDQFDKYIDFGDVPGAAAFNAVYSMLTYLFFLFDSIPYVKFEGLKGSGKTKAGTIHYLIDFNGSMSVSMTPAIIFRTVQDERGTLIVDEAENYRIDNETFQEIMPVYNSGNRKNGTVLRTELERGHRVPVRYSTYSPKIFCSINPMYETLSDRAYKIMLIKTDNGEKANIAPNEQEGTWQNIRDDLYLLLLQHYNEILRLSNSAEVLNSLELIGRDWDKAKPILTLVHFIEKYAPEGNHVREDIISFLLEQKEDTIEEGSESFESSILEVLTDVLLEQLNKLPEENRKLGKEIEIQLLDLSLRIAEREGFDTLRPSFNKKSFTKRVANRLKNMGLKKKTRQSTGNRAVFTSNLYDAIITARRYNIVNPTLTTLTTSPTLTKLTKLTKLTTKDSGFSPGQHQNDDQISLVSVDSVVSLGGEIEGGNEDKKSKMPLVSEIDTSAQDEKEGSPLNDGPLGPLGTSDPQDGSQEPDKSYVQSDEWQFFKVRESFNFEKYTYQKGKISKFPVLKAGIYIEKGLLELPCPSGQVWDPNEKSCINLKGGN